MNPIDLSGYQDGAEGLEGQGLIDESYRTPDEAPEAAEAAPTEEQTPAEPEGPYGFQQMIDGAAEALGLRSQEESQTIREESQAEQAALQENLNQDAGVLPEVVRSVAGGVTGAVESVGEFGELVGDTLKTVTGNAEDEDNVWSDSYVQADWDFGVAENLTGVGKFGREIVLLPDPHAWRTTPPWSRCNRHRS